MGTFLILIPIRMRRYILHTPFNIYHFKARKWSHPVHNHTYFEIIFILKGSGHHHINGNTFAYKKGDVFFLGPEDFHFFDIATQTEFCFVRFNESFNKSQADDDRSWQKIFKTLLYTSSQSRGSLVQDKGEQLKLLALLAVLEQEYENQQSSYFTTIRDNIMKTMIAILVRNLVGQTTRPVLKESAEAIMLYVRQNIYSPSKLTIEHLADVFNYAPEYISIFFKKHTGESLKQYIIKHKIKLIEARLMYSQLSLSGIADEFGYTDESHFCKQFRKYTGSTPTQFRKAMV
jgi:AraC family transcriptional regulator, L-rhamnose operon regulatory protein RhaS